MKRFLAIFPALLSALSVVLAPVAVNAQAGVVTGGGIIRAVATGGGGGGTSLLWDTGATKPPNATFLNGDRDFTGSLSGYSTARTTISISGTDKVCAEFTVVSPGGSPSIGMGIADSSLPNTDYLGQANASSMFYIVVLDTFSSTILHNSGAADPTSYTAGDLFMECVDYAAKKVYIAKNGTFGGGQVPATGTLPWLAWSGSIGTLTFAATYASGQTGVLRLAATGSTPPPGFTLLNH